jgi:ADP-ribose pyrophosphatase YjhB (NUDIX family)
MADSARHSVSVAGIIINDEDEVLLIQRRDNQRWEPPGGILELEESVTNGLRREIHEETGATVHIGPLTGVYKNMPAKIIALVFACSLASEPSDSSGEATRITWHPLSNVEQLMNQAYAVRVTDAAAFAGVPHIRAHDGEKLIED